VPGSEVSRFPAMAPPGRSPSATKTPPSSSSSHLDRSDLIGRSTFEDTGSAVVFAKETLCFSRFKPTVHGVFPDYAFLFKKRSLISENSKIRFHLFTILPLILF
jgi:hypothetical protein